MKRLLLLTLLAPTLAPAMETPEIQPEPVYNVPSLKFLASNAVGQIYKPKFIEEKTRLPQELKEHVFLLEQHHGQLSPYEAHQILIDSCMRGILDQKLLDDLLTINPNLDLNCSNGNNSPLSWAIWKANVALIEFLLDHGADINFSTQEVLPALHEAIHVSWAYDPAIIITVLRTLLKHGANIESVDKNGQTVLMHAVRDKKSIEAARFLLDNGALEILNHQDSSGNSALMHAVLAENIPALQVLLEFNPFFELTNERGNTAFSLACDHGNLEAMDLLQKAGANINHRSQQYPHYTPLLEAVSRGKNDVALRLLEYGADTEIGDDRNDTPLLKAMETSNEKLEELVGALVTRGANIHAIGFCDETPITRALAYGKYPLAIRLLLRDAQPIPAGAASKYVSALSKLVRCDDEINIDIMTVLLHKGLLNSFEGSIENSVYKDMLLHSATPTMKALIQNYRKPKAAPVAPPVLRQEQQEIATPMPQEKITTKAACNALRQLQQMGLLSKAMARMNPNVREQFKGVYYGIIFAKLKQKQ